MQSFKGWIWQDEGGVEAAAAVMVASSFHQASQELVWSPQVWDTPVRLPPLPLGNLNHIELAGMCAKLQPMLMLFHIAWITKYWQRQGLKVGVHLPISSSDCTNDLTSELFYFSDYLYWDYSFEDCLCINCWLSNAECIRSPWKRDWSPGSPFAGWVLQTAHQGAVLHLWVHWIFPSFFHNFSRKCSESWH